MHEQPGKIRRRVVPRWRMVESTPKDELTFSSSTNAPAPLKDEFHSLLFQWQNTPNVNNAAELLYSAALGFDDDPELYRAAQFVIDSGSAPPGLKNLAAKHLPQIRSDD